MVCPQNLKCNTKMPQTRKDKSFRMQYGGTWQLESYNTDISRACSSGYGPSFRLYSNVFCFMCNPSRIREPLISRCSEDNTNTKTGSKLEKLCHAHESISASYPYKNVFCYICNLPQQNGIFVKSFTTTTQEFQYLNYIMYTYNGTKLLHGQGLFAKISEHNETTEIDVTKKRDPDQLLLNGRTFNLSSLLLTRTLASPTKICNKDLLPDFIRDPGLLMRSILFVWQQVQLLSGHCSILSIGLFPWLFRGNERLLFCCDFGLENNVLQCYGDTGAIGFINPPTLRTIFGLPRESEPTDSLSIPEAGINSTTIFDQVNVSYIFKIVKSYQFNW